MNLLKPRSLLEKVKLSFLIYLCLLLSAQKADSETIKIGISASFTGTSREIPIEQYRGSMAYFEQINRNGGIKGKQIAIQAYDDEYNPVSTIRNTIKLIEKDKVFLLFNYFGTPTTARTLPLLNRYKDRNIYLFFPYTGSEIVRQNPYKPLVFNLRSSYSQETEGLVDNLVKVGKKRIAVFYQIDAYGRSGWNGVRRALNKHDLKIVAEATYRRGTSFSESFQPQVETLKAANPDAIILVGLYEPCAGFIRDARNGGWNIPIANISVGSENLLRLLLDINKKTGKDYTANLINSQVLPSYENNSLPAVREYREYMDRYKPVPPLELIGNKSYPSSRYSYDSFEGFLKAKLLVEILKRTDDSSENSVNKGAINAGNIGNDRRKVVQAAQSIQDIDLGIGTPFSFKAGSNQALNKVYYTKIEKGQFVPLTNWQQGVK